MVHDILILEVIRFFGEARDSYLMKLSFLHLLCVLKCLCVRFDFEYIMFDDVRHGYFRDCIM